MYIKVKSKDLYKLETAQETVREIAEILMKAAEVDDHGNSAYKSDRPLREIADILYFNNFIPSRHIIPKQQEQAPEKELQVMTR